METLAKRFQKNQFLAAVGANFNNSVSADPQNCVKIQYACFYVGQGVPVSSSRNGQQGRNFSGWRRSFAEQVNQCLFAGNISLVFSRPAHHMVVAGSKNSPFPGGIAHIKEYAPRLESKPLLLEHKPKFC